MNLNVLTIVSVERYRHKLGWHCLKHNHDFFQMTYIIQGTGLIVTEHSKVRINNNQLYLFPPGLNHEYISGKHIPLITIDVKFDIFNNMLKELLTCKNPLPQPEGLRFALENIVIETLNKDEFSYYIIEANFFSVLLNIIRLIKGGNECLAATESIKSKDKEMINVFKEVLSYINMNLHTKININNLAKLAHMEYTYFCKIFKKSFGVTPLNYINKLRLCKAKEMLTYSEENITEIANKTGFQTVQYLSNYFKLKEKVSPLEYRNNARNNIYAQFNNKYYNPWGKVKIINEKGIEVILDGDY